MKQVLLIAVMTLSASLAFAAGDQQQVVYDCTLATPVMDLGLHLQLVEGGIAGLTEIQTTRYFMGRTQNDTYVVQQKPVDPTLLGAPEVYLGQKVSFSINMTTAPRPDGTRLATFVTQQYGQETLKCTIK